MSTDYEVGPPMPFDEFIAKLPPEIKVWWWDGEPVYEAEGAFVPVKPAGRTGAYSHGVRKCDDAVINWYKLWGPSTDGPGPYDAPAKPETSLHVFVQDDMVRALVRYGASHVGKMIQLIHKACGLSIVEDVYGAERFSRLPPERQAEIGIIMCDTDEDDAALPAQIEKLDRICAECGGR